MQITIRASQLASTGCDRHDAAKLFKYQIQKQGFTLRSTKFGVAGKFGTSVHKAVQMGLQAKLDGNVEALTSTELADVALGTFAQEIAEDPENLDWDKVTDSEDTARKQIQVMAPAIAEIIDRVEPELVEVQLEADLSGISVTGKPDVITLPGPRAGRFVRDFKSGKNKQPGPHVYQLGTYSMLAKANGIDIQGLAVDYVKKPSKTDLKVWEAAIKKGEAPPVVPVVTEEYDLIEAEKASYSAIMRMAEDFEKFMSSGDPNAFKADPSSALCSPKYCTAHGTDFCTLGRPVIQTQTEGDE